MILYFIEYGFSFQDSEAVFRGPWAIQAVPAVALFVSLFGFFFVLHLSTLGRSFMCLLELRKQRGAI
ncbi:hypothetical protein V1507DRAFT_469578 [Lipomyces tetrasporus]